MGYNIPSGASGTFGQDTQDAVRHFQLDTGIGVDGKVGKNTLEALKQQAPSPNQKLVRSVEYDKLFADGRLDTTIAIGFDESASHIVKARETIQGLDEVAEVRMAAAQALGYIDTPEVKSALEHAAKTESDDFVKQMIRRSLVVIAGGGRQQ